MAIRVLVILDVDETGLHRELSGVVAIPPDYYDADRAHLFAIALENTVGELIAREGWLQPVRHALLANDARASRIEQLAGQARKVSSATIMEILNTPSQEAIDRWGAPAPD